MPRQSQERPIMKRKQAVHCFKLSKKPLSAKLADTSCSFVSYSPNFRKGKKLSDKSTLGKLGPCGSGFRSCLACSSHLVAVEFLKLAVWLSTSFESSHGAALLIKMLTIPVAQNLKMERNVRNAKLTREAKWRARTRAPASPGIKTPKFCRRFDFSILSPARHRSPLRLLAVELGNSMWV